MNFFDSHSCKSHTKCFVCRQTSDDSFRRRVMDNADDVLTVDFECPYGRPWDYEGLGDKVEKLFKPFVKVAKSVGVDLTNCGGCQDRKDFLNKLS